MVFCAKGLNAVQNSSCFFPGVSDIMMGLRRSDRRSVVSQVYNPESEIIARIEHLEKDAGCPAPRGTCPHTSG